MRLLVLADNDDLYWRHGSVTADLVISVGDVADCLLLDAARQCGCANVLAVRGNHDGATLFPEPILDLHLRTVSVDGLVFGGFEGCVRYKPRGHHQFSEEEAAELLARLPTVDVLVAHNSPRGVHERDGDVHAGFDALNDYIRAHRPRLVVHRHQHVNAGTLVGTTLVAGVLGHGLITLAV